MDTEIFENHGVDMDVDTEFVDNRGVGMDMDTEIFENRGVDMDMDTAWNRCPPNSGLGHFTTPKANNCVLNWVNVELTYPKTYNLPCREENGSEFERFGCTIVGAK